jgi:hypothetical protein
MTITITYLSGAMEPFEETLRRYFASNWTRANTNNVLPKFISPNGIDENQADLSKELSEVDVNALQSEGLILFDSSESIPVRDIASNDISHYETPVKITIYGRTKYEIFLFQNEINDIIHENSPSTATRITKSDGSANSAIAYFKQRKGVAFSTPALIEKTGNVYVSTGSLSCMWVKTITA